MLSLPVVLLTLVTLALSWVGNLGFASQPILYQAVSDLCESEIWNKQAQKLPTHANKKFLERFHDVMQS